MAVDVSSFARFRVSDGSSEGSSSDYLGQPLLYEDEIDDM